MVEIRQPPERPRPPGETPRPQGSLLPVIVVCLGVVALIVLLAVFAGPAGLMMAGVVLVLLMIPLLHYLVWGWWLSGTIRDEEKRDKK